MPLPVQSVLPRGEDEVAAVAAAIGMTIPPACMAGVVANLALLAKHAAILGGRS